MKPTTLLFDFGNVIIDIDIPSAIERIANLRSPKVPEDEFEAHVRALIEKYEVDAISTDLFINGVLKKSHHDRHALDVIEAWNSMLVGIPAYRLGMLQKLQDEFNVYILSNTNELHIAWVHNYLEETHGITTFEKDYLHEAYYSHLIKARKPNEDAFQYVIDDAYLTPAKTLFVDDTMENIETARRMGFQVLYSPHEEEIAEVLKLRGYY